MKKELDKKKNEHEIKFVINNSKSHQAIEWLKRTCKTDPQFPMEIVSSIYYDTWTWRFLNEKLNSDYLKTKVRVRWYSDINNIKHSKYSFAEAKFKVGNQRKKVRVKTPHTGKWLSNTRLDDPKLLSIPSLLRSKGIVLNENIFPVYQITYKRMRFLEPFEGLRVCFDYDISAPRVNKYMFPGSYPFMLRVAVFEIKGGVSELPVTLHTLTDIGCRKASFSKYGICFQKISRVNF